jgi:uncharacterized repeat protein (TIGR03803 family)
MNSTTISKSVLNRPTFELRAHRALRMAGATGAALALLAISAGARAQSITTLHAFPGAPGGSTPAGSLIQGPDGNFYGTTQVGGVNDQGTVYRMTPAGAITILRSFAAATGWDPIAGLVLGSDGNFYGTTALGGVGPMSGSGVVFRITPGGAYTVLHFFAASTAEGRAPVAPLVRGNDGNFYGTTSDGGPSGAGTIFRISPSGVFTVLHAFTGADGDSSQAPLALGPDGNFYGTASGGGAANGGVVFRITPAGVYTVLRSFTFVAPDGWGPRSGLTLGADGNFYGTTQFGGANGQGTTFRITPAGATTILHSFAGNEGDSPIGGLLRASDGLFYGTCGFGGSTTNGTLFSMTPAGAVTLLHTFTNQVDGGLPVATLLQASNGAGAIYGTTLTGGPGISSGTVFRLNRAGGPATFTTRVPVNHGWFTEENVVLSTPASITALTLTISVRITPGLRFSGMYQTVFGQITQSSVTGPTTITYTFTLQPGNTIPPGTFTFAAQTAANGVVHDVSGDTFTATYTSGGQTFTVNGSF